MDLEEISRHLYRTGGSDEEIISHLNSIGCEPEFSRALLIEIKNSEELAGLDQDLKILISSTETGLKAGSSGLGSRGEGDFIIHHAIAKIASSGSQGTATTTIVGPESQDDGGVVKLSEEKYLVVSVDGLHSRLGHFPFLAGFHVARACLRDVLVMGAHPVALFSDVHLANHGDPASILDYTAGISAVGDVLGVPLVAGSTLRIGGDLVSGDRLSGAAGAVGVAEYLTPRTAVKPGDVLVMSKGSGGGTIAAAAIFHGHASVLERTLNIDFLCFTRALLDDPIMNDVHSLIDVTNGGIRGDLLEMASTGGVDIVYDPSTFNSLVDPSVLEMLTSLSIDSMGVSIDSLLVACPESVGQVVVRMMDEDGIGGGIIGRVEDGPGNVYQVDPISGKREMVRPLFRESPYTPVKASVDLVSEDAADVTEQMANAVLKAEQKKQLMIERLEKDRFKA